MGRVCGFCDEDMDTGGCHRDGIAHPQCLLYGQREDTIEEKIGRAIIENLSDRRGIKHEINQIDYDVMAELRKTLGEIALHVISGAQR